MKGFFVLLAMLGGALTAVQVGVNNVLRAGVGSPVLAAFISFLVGSVCLGAYCLAARIPIPSFPALSTLPAWAWTGGAMGGIFVASCIIVAPKLGVSSTMAWVIAAQLAMSLILDHFGVLGFPVRHISPARLAGIGMLMAGAFLVYKY
ncbi:DMT family transporter [Pseudodesulfovibrio tunisiensis]|uniref:DMT family transporter n=1 Tax=Pseudodesulfovibrio tunisiensis TaxID=463192 RepID=UPI001FB1D3A3|nr:DMT family transporter [Pseudodesulfovibrio tunisiensis]